MYALSGSLPTDCTSCELGKADTDQNSWTQCTECPIGTIPAAVDLSTGRLRFDFDPGKHNATQCYECPVGTYLGTLENGAERCVACPVGRFNGNEGSSSIEDCQPCPSGT